MGENRESHPFSGFSELAKRNNRLARLLGINVISTRIAEALRNSVNFSKDWGNALIENFLGYYHLPIGIVCLPIDGEDRYILYATEETSVIAAACKAGKVIREMGATITTESVGDHYSVGQIPLIVPLSKKEIVECIIEENKPSLIEMANFGVTCNDFRRGGGVKDIKIDGIYELDGSDDFIFDIHVLTDTNNAMGANKVTILCEALGAEIQKLTECEVLMGILSNFTEKLVRARVELKDFNPEVGRRIQIASAFAKKSINRTVTHNKGMHNGIHAIVTATGNDSRAVSCLIDFWAMHTGRMTVSEWRMEGNTLIGEFEAPIDVGIVGGAMMHPMAELCLRVLNVETAKEFRRIIAAAALAQNFAALSALTDTKKRFSEGHMKLHAPNLAKMAGATEREVPEVVRILHQVLKENKKISLVDAENALREVRKKA